MIRRHDSPTTARWDETPLIRLDTRHRRTRRHRWISPLLLLAGVALVGYVAARKAEAAWAQRWASARLDEARREAPPAAAPEPEGTPPAPAPRPGEPVARLEIPRLSVDVVALEGVDPETLDRGVGHFPGSALPGADGNASFAGHRDSFFRALQRVAEGDEVRLETPSGEHVYRVTGTRVVGPDEVDVVAPLPGRQLTLVTCYPFDWIGPAPRRFVVRAALEEASS
ncbi:MAG: class D sortase [Thermoanaerobaculia bacterium]